LDPEPLSKVGLRAIEISINWRLVCTLFEPDFKILILTFIFPESPINWDPNSEYEVKTGSVLEGV
jgi:hypothetical protein